MSESSTGRTVSGEDEVVDLCRELIQIDTSNYGDHSGPGERKAAEYVAEKLAEVGLEPKIFESHPGRASTVARIQGEDPSRPALLIHGHTDVVPANAADWTHHPFSGEIADGCVWGRGAVDMKDMDAMTLAVVRDRLRSGRKPPRDIVLAFLADEEAGGTFGAHWLVEHHPELFAGVTEAIGEGGGFSYALDDTQRIYPIENAQRGMAWMELTATGRAYHGSSPNDENAVTDLSESLTRIGRHTFPIRLIEPVRALLAEAAELKGVKIDFDADDLDAELAKLGPVADFMQVVLRNSANPTMFTASTTRRTSSPVRPPPASTAASCPATSRNSSTPSTSCSCRPCGASGSTTTSPWRRRSTARSSTPCARPCAPRTPTATRSRTATRAAPTPRPSPSWTSAASASRASSCRTTWTTAASSTAWTSASRWRVCGSASAS